MRYNLNIPVIGYDGKNIQTNRDENGKTRDVILRDVIVTVLNADSQKEPTEPKDKAIIFRLSNLLYKENRVALGATDVAFIIDRAEKTATPLIYGRIKEVLDPDPEPESEEDGSEETENE